MENLKLKRLNFKNVMFSMAVIMLVWAVFWYPFQYFVFPKDLSTTMSNLIGISREYIRMLPAVLFFIHYKDIYIHKRMSKYFDKNIMSFLPRMTLSLCITAILLKSKTT